MRKINNKSSKSNSRGQRAIFEALPSRVMMSVTPMMYYPQYIVGHREASPIADAASPLSAYPTGLTPAQVRQAYGINQIKFGSVVGDGSGQTVAIVDAYDDPTALADLKTFDRAFGLPDPSFTKLNQTGGTKLPGIDPAAGLGGSTWEGEESLDIQWVHAIAPKAKIILIEADSPSFANLNKAVDTARHLAGVSAVSMSYGGPENSTDPNNNYLYTTPSGHTGVTFLASSGDSGSSDGPNRSLGTSAEASSPNVVGVGGTSLFIDASGNRTRETAWSGSGGGISVYEAEPAYQKALVKNTNGKRGVPDVSFLADPQTGVSIVDSFDLGSASPWETIGGTSLSCPCWAGLIAIADQGRVIAGKGTLDGATQTLPALYALPSADFTDITSGSNGAYRAGSGYDLVTGRGSPKANLVVAALAGSTATQTPTPTPTPTPAPTATKGSITGSVFYDPYYSGVFSNSAQAISGWTICLDLNRNGRFDTGDVFTTTNSAGKFTFSNLPLGNYIVAEVNAPGYIATNGGARNVTLTSAKANAGGLNFGVTVYYAPYAQTATHTSAGDLVAKKSIAESIFSDQKIA